jgi:hypothetical protein
MACPEVTSAQPWLEIPANIAKAAMRIFSPSLPPQASQIASSAPNGSNRSIPAAAARNGRIG